MSKNPIYDILLHNDINVDDAAIKHTADEPGTADYKAHIRLDLDNKDALHHINIPDDYHIDRVWKNNRCTTSLKFTHNGNIYKIFLKPER